MLKNNNFPRQIAVSTLILSKPRIIISVALTAFVGMVVAKKDLPPFYTMLWGTVSVLLSASGSAILNNVLDRNIDDKMSRLYERVEALDKLGKRNAVIISLLFIVASIVISFLFLNPINAFLIMVAILSYTFLYTLFLKRTSPFGTILGGIPGALPVLIGYSAAEPKIEIDGLILFAFMILWQPPHFWALAQKYKKDYKQAGIPVLPVVFGTQYTNIFILLYSLALIPLSLTLSLIGITSAYFAIFSLLAGGYFEYVIIKSIRSNSKYEKVFFTSIIYMLSIMLFITIDIIFLK